MREDISQMQITLKIFEEEEILLKGTSGQLKQEISTAKTCEKVDDQVKLN